MNKAILKDIEKNYLEAVKFYEEEINGNSYPNINYFINLAFLYWSFAAEQNEFNNPNNIPDEWSIIGEKNFLPVIDRGLRKYPNSLELIFWRKYLSHKLYMSDFSENDCKDLLKRYRNDNNLVPYFFLYLFDKISYTEKIFELRKICAIQPTAKNIYIKSFID